MPEPARIDLRDGLGRDPAGLFVLSTTPGAIYGDLLILGTRVGEGPGASSPGHVRAYDVRSGEIRWIDDVAQATKSGHVFVFARETGEPVPDRGALRPALGPRGRGRLAAAALAAEAAGLRAPGAGEDDVTDLSPARTRRCSRAAPVRSAGESSAEHSRHDDPPGVRRRRRVGRLGLDPERGFST